MYHGDLFSGLDNIGSAELCQDVCEQVTECQYFLYVRNQNKCYLVDSPQRTCDVVIGPTSPTIDECMNRNITTTTFPTTITTTTMITSSSTTTRTSTSTSTIATTTIPQKTLKILAVAGMGSMDTLSDVEFFNPYLQSNGCKKKPNYPQKIASHTCSGAICCGGWYGSKQYSNKCYELVQDEWLQKSNLVYARYDASSMYLTNGSLWVMGGDGDDSRKTAKSSEMMIQDNFKLSVTLPEEMYEHCMSKINDTHLFIAGGCNHNMAYLVNTAQEDFIFTPLPPMNEGRRLAACGTIINPPSSEAAKEDKLLIVAGGYDSRTISEIFSMIKNKWMVGPSLPRAFADGGYFSDEQHSLMMVGGRDEYDSPRSDVMEYEEQLNMFQTLPGTLNIPRHAFPATGWYTEEDC